MLLEAEMDFTPTFNLNKKRRKCVQHIFTKNLSATVMVRRGIERFSLQLKIKIILEDLILRICPHGKFKVLKILGQKFRAEITP
jgi:hypothetical protein